MSWQEGLRKLDEELAAGRISADEYRVRRDEVLSSAVTFGDNPAKNPPGQASDVADRTQEVSGWHAARPTTSSTDVEKTQIVPGVPTQSGFAGQPPRPAPAGYPQSNQYGSPPPWQQEEPAPWSGQEFPPLAQMGSPDWLRQGPEVFEAESGSKGTRILLILLAVVVVAGIGVGSYLLFLKDDGGNQAQTGTTTTSQNTQPPTTTPKPKDDLSVAELPGTAEDHSNVTTFADASSKLLTKDEIAIYTEAGAGRSRLAAAITDDKVHTLIFTTLATSPDAAKLASEKLAAQQLRYGMTEYDDAPANVAVAEFPRNETTPATIRAHYHHKGTIIRIQVNGDDLRDVTVVFEDLMAAQLEVLDATE